MLQCYKGAIPPKTPLSRRDVDAGSSLYYDCMQKVPVAKQVDVSTGSPEEYAALALHLLGQDAEEPEAAMQEQEAEPDKEKQEAKEAKRKYTTRGRALLRRPTDGKEVPPLPF